MIEILLATYNGEKFIKQQIDSLLEQTYQDFRILIRDDGSNDRTMNIVKEYEIKYPEKIKVIIDNEKCGNSASNFMELIKYATAEYIMFCDQDDYWFPLKLDLSLKKIQEIEKKNINTPVLIYTDYIKVNSDLKRIRQNVKSTQLYNEKLDLSHLLVQNYITGCCMIVNKSLYSNIGSYSKEILMHDWWLGIYASVFGVVKHIKVETMFYRQHDKQVVGATNVKSINYIIKKIKSGESRKSMNMYINQAKLFEKLYYRNMDEKSRKLFITFINLKNKNKLLKIYILIKFRFLKSDLIRILGQFWYI